MTFRLEIEMDNAAFDLHPGRELARILEEAGRRVKLLGRAALEREDAWKLRDVNGNTVSKAEIVTD